MKNRLHQLQSGEDYRSRQYWLTELGFSTYAAYLASPLWRRVRLKVLNKRKWACCLCKGAATQVHHSRYHKNDLLGKNLKFLHAVCGPCHETCEFTESKKKTSLENANSRMKWLAEKDSDGTTALERSRIANEQLDAEFDAIFKL